MNPHFITRTILIASLTLVSWVAAPSSGAADKKPKASALPVPSEGRNIVASGAVEDSLAACLARIPKDATAGQRMLAEDSCKRDQMSR